MLDGHRRAYDQSGRVVAITLIAVLAVGLTVMFLSRGDVAAQPRREPGMGMPGPMPLRPFPGGGPDVAMVVYKSHIYVAQGGTLYKIDPEAMAVVGEVQFVKPPPMPEPPRMPGPPGQPQ